MWAALLEIVFKLLPFLRSDGKPPSMAEVVGKWEELYERVSKENEQMRERLVEMERANDDRRELVRKLNEEYDACEEARIEMKRENNEMRAKIARLDLRVKSLEEEVSRLELLVHPPSGE